MNHRTIRTLWLFYWAPVAAWMLVIFVMSTPAGSADTSTGLIVTLLRKFAPHVLQSLSGYQLHRIDYVVRKLGHLTEYMVLTLLLVRAIQFGRPRLRLRAFFGALAISILFAISDEVHQKFSAGRTSSPVDVLIDTTGSVICMAGVLVYFGAKSVERRIWKRSGSRPDG